MEIDRIRILRDDAAVWLVYAGRGRSFIDEFYAENAIFLSLPGFAASTAVFESDDLTRRHLAMADQVARWVFGIRTVPPIRQASTYAPNPYVAGTAEAKGFSAELGNIRRMYRDAKAGDLVLSPRRGQLDPFLIGEIRSNWTPGDELAISTLNAELVPIRKVKWLDTALARRDFPPRIARRLQNQHAITRLDDRFYKEIFDLVYPSYVWQDNSKFDVYGDDYRGTDPTQIHPTAVLIKYVVASVFAFEKGQMAQFHALLPDQAVALYYDENLIAHFGQNFNSPGAFSVIARKKYLATLAAAGIIIALSGGAGNLTMQITHAVAAVSAAIDGPDKAAHQTHMNNYVHSMTSVDWNKVKIEKGEPSRQTLATSFSATKQVSTHREQLNAK